MKAKLLKNFKYILIGIIGLAILILVLVEIFKYQMPENKIGYPSLEYETGKKIDLTSLNDEQLTHFEVVSPSNKNKETKLVANLKTTNLTITQNGQTYMTLPYDLYGSEISNIAASPFVISYYYKGNNTPTLINAFEGSIKDGYFEAFLIKDGIRIVYEVGVREIKRSWIPQRLYKTEYETIYQNATLEQKAALQSAYNTSGDDLVVSLEATVLDSDLKILYHLWWDDLGLTLEELAERATKLQGEPSFVEMPLFKIPIDYQIDQNGDFIVTVLNDKIEENGPDLGDKSLKIKEISLLQNFVYTKTDTANENTFLFVPDGSGAVIKPYFKDQSAQYYKPFYQNNRYFERDSKQIDLSEEILFPVFGYGDNTKGILAIVESGAGLGMLKVPSISKITQMYPEFNLRVDDEYEFIKGVKITSHEELITDERIKMRYQLLQSSLSSPLTYYDLVKSLQQTVFHDVALKTGSQPILLELLGAILEKKHFIGIPYYQTVALTTYENAIEIKKTFEAIDLVYKYKGFSQGGINGKSQTKLKLDKSLGSKKAFKRLNEAIPELYYDVYLATKYHDKDQNFKNARNGLKTIGGNSRTYYYQDRMSLSESKSELAKYYVLNPNYLEAEINRFNKNCNLNNLALRDLGNTFYANYTLKPLNPNHTTLVVNEGLKRLKENHKLLMSKPFLESAIFASLVEDLPTKSSGHVSFYSDIPFLQLFFEPYFDTFSEPINLDQITKNSLNYALLSGSGLKYSVSFNDSSITKTTPYYNQYYATGYQKYSEEINQNYEIITTFRKENLTIKSHNLISPNIFLVTYDRGFTYLFNLSSQDFNYLGKTILANQYLKVN